MKPGRTPEWKGAPREDPCGQEGWFGGGESSPAEAEEQASSQAGTAPAVVRLIPMEPAELDPYLDRLVRSYSEDHIRAGRWSAKEGLDEARKEVQRLLPGGLETPNHFLYTVVGGSPEAKVGVIWLALEPRGGFVYDLLIHPSFRRRGYAEEAMRLLEQVAKEKGARKLFLHVFADNLGARNLYVKLGYVETNVVMSKPLSA